MFYFEKSTDSLLYIRLWLTNDTTDLILHLENITVFMTDTSCSFGVFIHHILMAGP